MNVRRSIFWTEGYPHFTNDRWLYIFCTFGMRSFFFLSSEFDSDLIDEIRWLVGLWRFITSLGLFHPLQCLFTHAKIWQKFETRVNGFIFKRFSSAEEIDEGNNVLIAAIFNDTGLNIFHNGRKEKCVLHDGDDVQLNYYLLSDVLFGCFMKNRASSKYYKTFFCTSKMFY